MINKAFLLVASLFFVFIAFVFVQDTTPALAASYANPLKFNSLEGVLGDALAFMQNIIVVLAIIFIVVGAVLYITSAGNESQMKTAKSAITAALIGLALGIAAPSFLKEISAALGWGAVDAAIANAQTLTSVAGKVLNFLLSITGVIAIIMMVIGGLVYLTAGGDESKAEVGKKIVTYAMIGVVVSLGALVIVTQIVKFF
ncbi:MAG: hypothetical protein KBD27_02780 [Candidatus Moranbacteria bacterium]|nr:hypothetical protein [Candidatus Moranbacteria bacterium]